MAASPAAGRRRGAQSRDLAGVEEVVEIDRLMRAMKIADADMQDSGAQRVTAVARLGDGGRQGAEARKIQGLAHVGTRLRRGRSDCTAKEPMLMTRLAALSAMASTGALVLPLGNRRHDRGVDDAQPVDAAHLEIRRRRRPRDRRRGPSGRCRRDGSWSSTVRRQWAARSASDTVVGSRQQFLARSCLAAGFVARHVAGVAQAGDRQAQVVADRRSSADRPAAARTGRRRRAAPSRAPWGAEGTELSVTPCVGATPSTSRSR